MSEKSYLMLVLHAHIPFINNDNNSQLEENWFFEAVAESYIPIIKMLENLINDGIKPSIAISISPTLGAMLENDNMEKKLRRYIESRQKLCEQELANCRDEKILKIIKMYQQLYDQAAEIVVKYSGDLITPLKNFQHNGYIEILTTSATHSVLPLYGRQEFLNAQSMVSFEDYCDRFNKNPTGFWLPECAYEERVNLSLKSSGFKYFIVDQGAIENIDNNPYIAYATSKDIKYFVRDFKSSMDVWSARYGYPSNGVYREFYRDIGYERDLEYLYPYTNTNYRVPTGLKYYKITDRATELGRKELYDYDEAFIQAGKDAGDFLNKTVERAKSISKNNNERNVIVNCYDAELFGHWWFEGPEFLEQVIRKIRYERYPLQTITPREYLEMSDNFKTMDPEISSWGENGYFDPWLNEKNDFIYTVLHELIVKMVKIANRFKNQDINNITNRTLNQIAREILLASSSDWAFLIYTGSHSEYAKKRFYSHVSNAEKLMGFLNEKNIDEAFLTKVEKENYIFSRIDFRVFCSDQNF